jgi:hypothetical protein
MLLVLALRRGEEAVMLPPMSLPADAHANVLEEKEKESAWTVYTVIRPDQVEKPSGIVTKNPIYRSNNAPFH